jgi:signal transduction histidine kinase
MVQRADGKTLVQGITRINDEEKKFRLALQQKEERLQKLIETKDRLLAIISHDLKTPVHAAKGILNLLQTEQQHFSNEERDEMIALLKKSNEQQEELIEDLLTWSQTQNDRIKVHYQRINLQNVAKQAIKSSQLRADQKNIEIATNIDEDIAVQADLFMLETILRNLISNAVKFTNAGGKITIGSELKADGQKKVRIYVKDEGIGMPSNLIKDIQKQRYRRSQKGTEQESGTGMGLMITQEFIKNLDSSLQINSKLAEGSTFSFLLDASEKETH